MKSAKKILAIGMAALMTMTMGISAFAADMATSGVMETTDNTITIKKEIVFTNEGADVVYEPNITYGYAIAPAAPNETGANAAARTTVKDVNGRQTTVHAGVANGALFAGATPSASTSVTFSAANQVADVDAAGSKSATKTMSIVIDPTQFGGVAGVYRYKITETPDNAALTAAGITRSDVYSNTRYLDVYLKNNAAGTALEVYGYVLFDGADTTSFDGKTPETADLDPKTEGFVRDDDVALGIGNVDVYHTYNVKVTKNITGDLADMTHDFPFVFTLGNTDANAAYTYKNVAGTASKTMFDGQGIEASLGHNDHVEFIGLPANATIQAVETNDTYDVYTATVTQDEDGAVSAVANLDRNQTQSLAASAVHVSEYSVPVVSGAAKADQDYRDILFTNNLQTVSPTGVVLRILPYAIMLMAGAVAMVMIRRMNERKSFYQLG